MIPTEILTYQSLGFSFFALPYGKKESYIKWEEYQKRKPREDEITTWFGNGQPHNVAIVCGIISGGLVILDCDSEERYCELIFTLARHGISDIQDFTLVAQTGRGYHIFLFVDELPPTTKFPKLDIKSEGGYIVAPPSLHPNGKQYHFVNPGHSIARIKNLLEIGINVNQKKETQQDSEPDNWVSRSMLGVGEGSRDDTCAKLAGYFLNKHAPDIVKTLLYTFADKCQPPFPHIDVDKVVNSLARRHPLTTPDNPADNKELLYLREKAGIDSESFKSVSKSVSNEGENVSSVSKENIEEWVRGTSGWFSYEALDREFGIKSADDKRRRRVIFNRLRDEKVIENHPSKDGLYRYINVAVRLIDFKAASKKAPINIKFPFGIEKYASIYPGNIIVLAGAANAGKTALLLNFIRMNMSDFAIFYQSSEMGQDELAIRLEKFEGIELQEWNFSAEERSTNFADVIRPDCINIIDYMELSTDCYLIAEYLKQIHDKLSSGIALVALQKKINSDYGRGGEFGLEKPRLYLSMNPGKLTITKAKNWANPETNPNGMCLDFKIAAGCKFITTRNWYQEGEI